MKKIVTILSSVLLLASISCQKNNTALMEKIAKLEKRIEVLEKRLTASGDKKQRKKKVQSSAFDIPVGQSYVLGNTDAPLTLVKFSDYQCPFCSRAHENFIEKIFEDKELKDKVRVVFKHFPLSFHKKARPASKAALAAGEQGRDCFWKMTSKLYGNQRNLTEENFKKWASEIKCKRENGKIAELNTKKFWSDYKNNDAKYEKMIKEDMSLGMNKANVRGTPSFYLNGWKVNRRSVSAIKDIIKKKELLN